MFKIAICVLLTLIQMPLFAVADGDLSHLPAGAWVGKIKEGQNRYDIEVRVYPSSYGFILVKNRKDIIECFQEFGSYAYSFAESDLGECVDDEASLIVLPDGSLQLNNDERKLKLKAKKASKRIEFSHLAGEWVAKKARQLEKMSFYPNGTIVAMIDDEVADLALVSNDVGHQLILANEAESVLVPVLSVSNNRIKIIDDGKIVTIKKHKKYPESSVLLDENGNPLKINHLDAKVTVFDNYVKTHLSMTVTNLSPDATEANLRLPLPSDAKITGYALDVNGELVEAVAVPKDKANEAFTTLEQRGVDPGIVSSTLANQFTTEIYPIRYQQSRQISISYQQVITADNRGRYQYELPLDAFGVIDNVTVEMKAHAIESASVRPTYFRKIDIDKRGQDFSWRWSKNNFRSKKPVKFSFDAVRSSVAYFVDSEFKYVSLRTVIDKQKFNKRPLGKVALLWDVSSSMEPHYSLYVPLLQELVRKGDYQSIDICPVGLNATQCFPMDIEQSIPHMVFDGATRPLSLMNSLQKTDADTYILFGDGKITFGGGNFDLNEIIRDKYVIAISPNNSNKQFLRKLASAGGSYSLTKNNEKDIVESIHYRALSQPGSKSSAEQVFSNVATYLHPSLEMSFRLAREDFNGLTPSTELIERLPPDFAKDYEGANWYENSLAKDLWVSALIDNKLSAPRLNEREITDLGVRYSVVTPFTSLIVLEDLDDYVEFGIAPPKAIDPSNEYLKLKEARDNEEYADAGNRYEYLKQSWQSRVDWWSGRQVKKENAVPLESSVVNEAGMVEEVAVYGIRASLASASITIEPWNPNVPYLAALKTVGLDGQYEKYLSLKKVYGRSPSFYMDIAKYFFEQEMPHLAVVILSNVIEFQPEKLPVERMAAYTYMQYGQFDMAEDLLTFIDKLAPFEATSKRDLALVNFAIYQQTQDQDALLSAISYMYSAALESDDEADGLPVTALWEMNEYIALLEDKQKINFIDGGFIKSLPVGLRVVISWANNMVDLDLHVSEPSGEKVYYGNRESRQGALLPYDDISGYGPEEYLLKAPKPGEYVISSHYFGSDSVEAFGPATVKMDVFVRHDNGIVESQTSTVRLDMNKESLTLGRISIH